MNGNLLKIHFNFIFCDKSEKTLCILLGITSFIVMTEIPLAIYLYRAVRKVIQDQLKKYYLYIMYIQ